MSILSIQSHVAHGYVGNKAAVYPLQSMGYDVWPVNTVQFSNHTGYEKWRGEVFSKEHISSIVVGLEEMNLVSQCKGILSGYMGDVDICYEVLSIVQRFKKSNPNIIYLCDPVIGNTNCYVKPGISEFFQNNLYADIITPNQFEVEILTGIQIQDSNDVKTAAKLLLNKGIKIIVFTGLELHDKSEDMLYSFVCNGKQEAYVEQEKYQFTPPLSGTGDLFSALFLGYFLQECDIFSALRKTVYSTNRVIKRTFETGSKELRIIDFVYRDNFGSSLMF